MKSFTRQFPTIALLRPHHWLKNLLVFAGVFFGHSLDHPTRFAQAVVLFAAFCATASAIYIINDYFDRHADRVHPQKSFRPIAARLVDPRIAMLQAHLLLAMGWVLGFYSAGLPTLGWVALYTLVNLAYCRWLKHFVIIDVALLSSSYLIRLLAGTDGLSIPISSWLLLCGLSGAMMLGFGKRYAEKKLFATAHHRASVSAYSEEFLRTAIAICIALLLVFYGLFCLNEASVAFHGRRLILTYPWIILSMFRYLQLSFSSQTITEDPATLLIRDKPLLMLALGWIVTFVLIVYIRR